MYTHKIISTLNSKCNSVTPKVTILLISKSCHPVSMLLCISLLLLMNYKLLKADMCFFFRLHMQLYT